MHLPSEMSQPGTEDDEGDMTVIPGGCWHRAELEPVSLPLKASAGNVGSPTGSLPQTRALKSFCLSAVL